MTYVDTSVLLAQHFAEDRLPPDAFWAGPLVSSRLAEYEVWTRVHARQAGTTHGDAARDLLARVSWLELLPNVLARALDPFPVSVRTLDALHLASARFLQQLAPALALATYDVRLASAARALGLAVVEP